VAVAPVARLLRWMLTVCGAVPLLVWLGDIAVRRFRLAPSEVVDARMRVVELLRESRGAVDERQVAMAGRVLELSRRGVGALMTPWKRVASLADDALPQVVRETLRRSLKAQSVTAQRLSRGLVPPGSIAQRLTGKAKAT
jgi:CBS domain containing-hemolysin-like protein